MNADGAWTVNGVVQTKKEAVDPVYENPSSEKKSETIETITGDDDYSGTYETSNGVVYMIQYDKNTKTLLVKAVYSGAYSYTYKYEYVGKMGDGYTYFDLDTEGGAEKNSLLQ